MSAGSGSPNTASSRDNKWSKKKIIPIKETEVEEDEATRGRAESGCADAGRSDVDSAFDWTRREKRRRAAGIALMRFFANTFCLFCLFPLTRSSLNAQIKNEKNQLK